MDKTVPFPPPSTRPTRQELDFPGFQRGPLWKRVRVLFAMVPFGGMVVCLRSRLPPPGLPLQPQRLLGGAPPTVRFNRKSFAQPDLLKNIQPVNLIRLLDRAVVRSHCERRPVAASCPQVGIETILQGRVLD
jgi:hypothetical protein